MNVTLCKTCLGGDFEVSTVSRLAEPKFGESNFTPEGFDTALFFMNEMVVEECSHGFCDAAADHSRMCMKVRNYMRSANAETAEERGMVLTPYELRAMAGIVQQRLSEMGGMVAALMGRCRKIAPSGGRKTDLALGR
jgi:hypothetical protein